MPKNTRIMVELSGDYTCTGKVEQLACRKGSGMHVIYAFNPQAGDRVMFDIYGQWSDIMFLGHGEDGMVIDLPKGDFLIEEVGSNTKISAGTDGVILAGWQPEAVYGWMLQGG